VAKLKPFLFGSCCGALLMFVGLRYHVVRYADGVMLVPRSPQPPVRSSYVDVREWGTAMWKQYPEVATALVADGRGKLVAEGMAKDLLQPDALENDDARAEPKSSASAQTKGEPGSETPAPLQLKPLLRSKLESLVKVDPPTEPQTLASVISVDERPSVGQSDSVSRPDVAQSVASEQQSPLRSALEMLFAPYEASEKSETSTPAATGDSAVTAADPQRELVPEPNDRSRIPPTSAPTSSIPVQPASKVAPAAPDTFMDLQSLDVELGQPTPLGAGAMPPRQAESLDTAESGPPATGAKPADGLESI
jgi:hypothetical protein